MKFAKMDFRRIACVMSLLSLGPACLAAGAEADYPNRPVRIVVGFPPGQGVDTMARAFAPKLQALLGRPFIVDNKSGAGGIIGQQAVASSPADGYTIMLTSSGPMAINPSIYEKLPYDPIKSYAPIAGVTTIPLVMVINPDFAAQNLQQLIAQAQSQPGKINFASGGSGLTNHLAMEMFSKAAGISMSHVPYKGSPPALTDVMAGRVSVMFDTPLTVLSLIKDGRLKPIAVSGTNRMATLADVPTVAESGFPGFSAFAWWAFVAPAGTPEAIVAKLNDAITKTVNAPDMHKYFAEQGVEPMPMTPAGLGAFIASEIEKWGKAAKGAGAKVD